MNLAEASVIGDLEFELGWTALRRGVEEGSGDGGSEEVKKWVSMALDSQPDEQWQQRRRRWWL